MVNIAILQVQQIAAVLCCAPLLRGIINRLKAIVQSKRGPSIWQPYRDLWKLLHKGSVVSEHASWVYHAAPIFSFITPLIVAMLIPVLTAYPLPYAFMGDMLAGGFILSLGGFFTSLAAIDMASTFGCMGSSRAHGMGWRNAFLRPPDHSPQRVNRALGVSTGGRYDCANSTHCNGGITTQDAGDLLRDRWY